MKKILTLFVSMFKIGLFTFGGGYAMISILQNEFVEKKKWITEDEFMSLVMIAESTPGPIAINSSTYIGYKVGKLLGAIVATIAICLPSFIIIYVISLFFDQFLENQIVFNAFRGIQVCVIYLIFMAGVKMFKKIKKNVFDVIVATIVLICLIVFSLLSISVSTIYYILVCGLMGLIIYFIGFIKSKEGK